MPMQNIAVVVILVSAVAFLIRHGMAAHRKQKQHHTTCARCPIAKAARPRF